MERDTLIKVFALLFIIAFIAELFAFRSSVTSPPQQSNQSTSNETSLYGTGNTTAVLDSYMDYLNVYSRGKNISAASLNEISSIEGVGYANRQDGAVTLVLDNGANLSFIAERVKEEIPDANVTASAVFSLPPLVEFRTSMGRKNVSVGAVLVMEITPEIDVGENITLSLIGLISGDRVAGTPIAKIIPTSIDVVANAVVSGVGDNYSAVVMLPWEGRNANTSKVKEDLSKSLGNVSVEYEPRSFVAVSGLSSKANETIERIGNLSYVVEVSGDVVYVKDDFNDSGRIRSDFDGILGNNNTALDYSVSSMVVSFTSANFSKNELDKEVGSEFILYRQMFLKLGDTIAIAGREYEVPSNSTFTAIILDSFSVGSNVTVSLRTGTIGKKIVELELKDILG